MEEDSRVNFKRELDKYMQDIGESEQRGQLFCRRKESPEILPDEWALSVPEDSVSSKLNWLMEDCGSCSRAILALQAASS